MIIVLAVGLLILGFGGRWLKKRHDRKQDRITGGFNSGITDPTRFARSNPSMAQAAPAHMSGRDSPMRTREAFMPYGYGYARSESQLGGTGSPLARGGTPVGDLERADAMEEAAPKGKARRVLVRERSGDDAISR